MLLQVQNQEDTSGSLKISRRELELNHKHIETIPTWTDVLINNANRPNMITITKITINWSIQYTNKNAGISQHIILRIFIQHPVYVTQTAQNSFHVIRKKSRLLKFYSKFRIMWILLYQWLTEDQQNTIGTTNIDTIPTWTDELIKVMMQTG